MKHEKQLKLEGAFAQNLRRRLHCFAQEDDLETGVEGGRESVPRRIEAKASTAPYHPGYLKNILKGKREF